MRKTRWMDCPCKDNVLPTRVGFFITHSEKSLIYSPSISSFLQRERPGSCWQVEDVTHMALLFVKEDVMPNTNSSFSPVTRTTQLHAQLEKLESLGHRQANDRELAQFDNETEELLGRHFGPSDARLEAYKYATLAEAETLVNMPESAQEQSAQDLPKKALQQRRQVLE